MLLMFTYNNNNNKRVESSNHYIRTADVFDGNEDADVGLGALGHFVRL